MQCEKCERADATTLVVDQPDYVHDRLAGWFMCEECFALDPSGWYEVLDATQIDTVDVLPAKAVPKRPAPRAKVVRAKAPAKPKAKRQAPPRDDAWLERAYQLHQDGMPLKDVAAEVMDERGYKSIHSATESLRINFRKRGWDVHSTKRTLVAT